MRRFIVTGAPGAGKTTLLTELAARGHRVVPEAATDLIRRRQAEGAAHPWTDDHFLDDVLALQKQRQADGTSEPVVLFDRSPICTLALARYSNRPVPMSLATEVERLVSNGFYDNEVLFVRLLGFIEPTPVRRISYADSLRFERIHEQTYSELGFRLVDVHPEPVQQRAVTVEALLSDLATRSP